MDDPEKAIEEAKRRMKEYPVYYCSDGTKEPIDWIQVYKNWNMSNEELLWGTYENEEEKEL